MTYYNPTPQSTTDDMLSPLTTDQLNVTGQLMLNAMRHWLIAHKCGQDAGSVIFKSLSKHDLGPAAVLLDVALTSLTLHNAQQKHPRKLIVLCPLHRSMSHDEAALILLLSFMCPNRKQTSVLVHSLTATENAEHILSPFMMLKEYLQQHQLDIYFSSTLNDHLLAG